MESFFLHRFGEEIQILGLRAICEFRTPGSIAFTLLREHPEGPHVHDQIGRVELHYKCENPASPAAINVELPRDYCTRSRMDGLVSEMFSLFAISPEECYQLWFSETIGRFSNEPLIGTLAVPVARLQPLIVTDGWHVSYHQFYDVDASFETVTDVSSYLFKEDLFQASNDRRSRIIDLGWYPECDFENGQFGLVLYAGDFSQPLIDEFRSKDREEVVVRINTWMEDVSAGRL